MLEVKITSSGLYSDEPPSSVRSRLGCLKRNICLEEEDSFVSEDEKRRRRQQRLGVDSLEKTTEVDGFQSLSPSKHCKQLFRHNALLQ